RQGVVETAGDVLVGIRIDNADTAGGCGHREFADECDIIQIVLQGTISSRALADSAKARRCAPNRSDVHLLDWNAQGVRHEKIIVDATPLGELERATHATEHVVIDADLMQRRVGSIEKYLKDDIVRPRLDRSVALRAQDELVADDVP